MAKNGKQIDPEIKTEFSLFKKMKRRYCNTNSNWLEEDQLKSTSERNEDMLKYAFQGNKKMVKIALQQGVGADMYATDSNGNNALILAAASGATEVVSYLLELGMSPNKINNDNLSALHIAVRKNRYDIVRKLIEYGADVELKGQFDQTALFDTVIENNIEMLNFIFKCTNGYIDIDTTNREGRTPFMVACHNKGRQEIMMRLIELGAKLGIADNNGRTAFMHATNNDFGMAMDVILKNRPQSVNDSDNEGITPAMVCAKRGNREGLRILIMKGANLDAQDKNGKEAYDYAKQYNNNTCMEIILKAKKIKNMQISEEEKQKLLNTFGKQNKVQNSCVK